MEYLNQGKHFQMEWVIIVAILIFIVPGIAGDDNIPWELVKDENGIKVFTRENNGSQLKEFKGITQINTSLASLITLYYDRESYHEWFFACENSMLLKEISFRERYFYTVTGAPWPISHRDIIIHSILTQNPDSKEVLITEVGIKNFIPENTDMVRVTEMEGFFKFTPIKDDVIEVTYQCYSNPGGILPAFLINTAAVDCPFVTLSNMKSIVKKGKYQDASIDYLK